MRILQISPSYYPAISIGGPIFTSMALHSACNHNGHTVDVETTKAGISESDLRGLTGTAYQGDLHVHLEGSTIKDFQPISGRIVYRSFFGPANFTFSPGSFWPLFRNIQKYDLIIMHGVWNFPIIIGGLLCRFFAKQFIIFPHGALYKETIELKSRYLKKIFLFFFVNRILRAASFVIFTTIDEKDKVTAFLNLDIRPFVLPNIVNFSNYKNLPLRGKFRRSYGIPQDAMVLLHFGRINMKKGIIHSVQVIPKLMPEFPKVVLVVVGGDEDGYRVDIESVAQSLGVLDRVFFTGLVNFEIGRQALVDADIFVLPSLSENFGMAVVEAMYCRLPVVVSENVGIAPDIARCDAGKVFALSSDNKALISILAELLRSRSERRALGERGFEFAVSNYDEKVVNIRLKELLKLLN